MARSSESPDAATSSGPPPRPDVSLPDLLGDTVGFVEPAEDYRFAHPGQTIARYVVLDRAGLGAMGAVYKAYDPVLDRTVALKLLHGKGSHARRERVLREAQALARVAHPNVIAIHDVGVVDDDVYLATEFVVGETLDQWLRSKLRTQAAIVAVFVEAGEGLAAAHRAGLIHRDFKPANVMVGQDKRARVLDFGLARGAGTRPAADPLTASETSEGHGGPVSAGAAAALAPNPSSLTPLETNRLVDAALTAEGFMAGTPRYMAPEQCVLDALTPAVDQFAFCVSLWEALAQRHPFVDDDGAMSFRDALFGGARLGRRVRRVLERGMRLDPAARYPSMSALLAALRQETRFTWRHALALSVGLFAVIATLFVNEARQRDPCRVAGDEIADAWSPARTTAIAAAFERTGWQGSQEAFGSLRDTMDRYAHRWVEARRAACVAARTRGASADTPDDRTLVCLDRRLSEMRAATTLLANADRTVAARSMTLAGALGDIDDCAASRLTLHGPSLPTDPSLRTRVVALGVDMEEASVLKAAGRAREARAALDTVVTRARTLGYEPLLGEALLRVSDVQALEGDSSAALRSVDEGTELAGHSGDDSLFATGLLARAELLTCGLDKPQEAFDLRPVLVGAIERVGISPRLASRLHADLSRTLDELGRYDEAVTEAREAVRIAEADAGAEPQVAANALRRLAAVERLSGAHVEARTHAHEALSRLERLFGRQHPELFDVLLDTASAESSGGDVHLAEALIRRAISSVEAVDPETPRLTNAYRRLGSALLIEGRRQEAEDALERAAALAKRATPPDAMALADIYSWLGDVIREARGIAAARPYFEQMSAYYRDGGRTMDPFFGEALALWGEAECRAGEKARAAALYAEARPILLPRTDMWRPKLLVSEGECFLASKRESLALPLAEEAVSRLAATSQKDDLADARFLRARAWFATGAKRRGVDEARAAAAELAGTGRVRMDEMNAWVAEHAR